MLVGAIFLGTETSATVEGVAGESLPNGGCSENFNVLAFEPFALVTEGDGVCREKSLSGAVVWVDLSYADKTGGVEVSPLEVTLAAAKYEEAEDSGPGDVPGV